MGFLWGSTVLLCTVALLRVEGSEAQQTKNNVPRLKLSYKEMLESKNLETFEGLSNSSAYHTLFLDEEKGRLVVGAKDHILSFNLLNISKGYAQIPWSASPTRRDECKWAGKDVALKEAAGEISLDNQYIYKDDIPEYPQPQFQVSFLKHDTTAAGLKGIRQKGGFRNPYRGPLVWWSLSVRNEDIKAAEKKLMEEKYSGMSGGDRPEEVCHLSSLFTKIPVWKLPLHLSPGGGAKGIQ
ncbi:Semaphorin-3ab [Oryzias melastigma]|uniref:Semaphorin-3ab n=1 Tax=Oryzias melastigma TaxID=30732 RepID=A0A834BQ70_ORYME|nr:Semaphorin-3ab [Oryzias melastigma]